MYFKIIKQNYSVRLEVLLLKGCVCKLSFVSTLEKYTLLSLDFDSHRMRMICTCPSHVPVSLPKCNLNFMLHFLIQKRGSRKGLIELKKIRCVEKVNLEEQTPVERQYPFQVRGGTTFHWPDGPSEYFPL